MSTEMGATRLLAPYFGTSLLIWAQLIGLVLLYLTVGYVLGGRLADRHPDALSLYKLTAWAGFLIVLVPILTRPLLLWSVAAFDQLSVSIFFVSLFSIIALFAPPLVLLGCVSPWAIRLNVRSVESAGGAAGSLYALSTMGSLVGTFGSVLVLQPTIGTRASIWVFGIGLLALSLLGLAFEMRRRTAVLPYAAMLGVALLLVMLTNGGGIRAAAEGTLLYEDESADNYIQVTRLRNETRLILNEGHAIHSVYNPERLLTGGPWDYFALAPLFRPAEAAPPKEMLLIGLAAGTVSNQYARMHPGIHIDGVEIDEQIIEVGHRYFDMEKPNLTARAADGRTFMLAAKKRYDIIAIDAYRQPYIPFHLATREFFEDTQRHLKPGGVVVINVGRAPNDYRLVDALGSTMGAVYPSVFVVDTERYLNSLIYATKEPSTAEEFRRRASGVEDPYLRTVASAALQTGKIRAHTPTQAAFTDDLAPIEQVINQIIVDYAVDGDR